MSGLNINEELVFDTARRIKDKELRADYVEQVCVKDPALKARVSELLSLHDEEESLFASPPQGLLQTLDASQISEKPGAQIGPYKLLQQIGEGGMGVVYMAEQTKPVERRVALKIIKPGMDTKQVIARFEAERQALAMMDHPNIARVLDAGTTDSGRPYFVMELVKGVTITDYCDEHHLTPKERLELFLPVLHAVQHAHQKGIIHRDIKPSNVLVAEYDNQAVPKVIDFGVAKATNQRLTDKTMFTQYGQLIGTLEYMSPEQAKLNQMDIDTRSDIYSLGVLLYELLTGDTPFDRKRLHSAAFDEMMRIIREEVPPRPSTRLSTSAMLDSVSANRKTEPGRLTGLVRGELDWIVMKALDKDRNRRYETANAFAADVGRYLRDEPVEACPPSATYRLRKFAGRHKASLAIATAFLGLLLTGVAVSTWQAVRANLAEGVARRAKEGETTERERAEANAHAAQASEAVAERQRVIAVQQRDAATQAQRSAVQEKSNALAVREELRHTLYASEMSLVQAAWESKQYGRSVQLLKDQPTDLHGFEWHYWQRQLQRGRVRSVPVPSNASPYRWNGTRSFSRDAARLAALVGYPDELATAAGPRLLSIVDGVTGREMLTPFDPFPDRQGMGDRKQRSLSMSDDGGRLAVALVNGFTHADDRFANISIRDGETGGEIRRLEIPGLAFEIALSPDGSRLAVECGLPADPLVKTGQTGITIWDTSTGELVQTLSMLPRTRRHGRILWSPDGVRLLRQSVATEVVNETDQFREVIQVVDVASGEKKWERAFPTLDDPHYAWAWSPDGKLLVILEGTESGIAANHDIQLWDSDTGTTLAILDQSETQAINSNIAFSPDGQLLAVVCGLNEINVWEVPKLPLVDGSKPLQVTAPRLAFLSDKDVLGLAFSADGSELHSLDAGPSLVTWDTSAHKATEVGPNSLEGHFASKISSDATKIAFEVGGQNPMGIVWDLGHNREVFRTMKSGTAFNKPALSHDGRRVAFAVNASRTQKESQIVIHDTQSGDIVKTIQVDDPDSAFLVRGPALRSDGGQIAALLISRANVQNRGPARLVAWDVTTGKQLFSVAITSNGSDAPDYSRDDSSVILVTDDRVEEGVFFDAQTGERQKSISMPSSDRSYWIDERIQIIGSFDRTQSDAVFWDLATGKERLRLSGYGDVSVFAISPDGSRLVLGKYQQLPNQSELTLWNAKSGRRLLALQRPGRVNSISFSPDGNRLVATFSKPGGTSIKPIQVWDATPLANP